MLGQKRDDVVFGLGQLDLFLPHEDLAALVVDGEVLCTEGARGVGAVAVGAQRRPHPRQQLAGAEGLGDVVVGTEVQRLDLVRLGGAGRQHDDGGQVLLAHIPDQLHAIPVRQTEVEDDQVWVAGTEHRLPQFAGGGHKRLVAVGLQQGIDEAADIGLVFYDQHFEFVIAHLDFPPSQWIRFPARSGWSCPRLGGSRP